MVSRYFLGYAFFWAEEVMVFLAMPDGGVQLMVFRLSDGRQTGTIELQPSR